MSLQDATEVVKVNVLEFRFALAWFALFTLNALASSLILCLTNVTYSTLDTQGEIMIWVAVILNWTNTIMAFMSSQAKRIKKTGELFPSTDDIQQFTRVVQQTNTEQTTVKPIQTPPV